MPQESHASASHVPLHLQFLSSSPLPARCEGRWRRCNIAGRPAPTLEVASEVPSVPQPCPRVRPAGAGGGSARLRNGFALRPVELHYPETLPPPSLPLRRPDPGPRDAGQFTVRPTPARCRVALVHRAPPGPARAKVRPLDGQRLPAAATGSIGQLGCRGSACRACSGERALQPCAHALVEERQGRRTLPRTTERPCTSRVYGVGMYLNSPPLHSPLSAPPRLG